MANKKYENFTLNGLFEDKETIMVDIETCGLNANKDAITSVCFVKFNLLEHKLERVVEDYYHKAVNPILNHILHRENPDDEVLKFRKELDIDGFESNLESVTNIPQYQNEIKEFFQQYGRYTDRHFFFNHNEFDAAFLNTYQDIMDRQQLWHYRNTWDITSLLLGMNIEQGSAVEYIQTTGIMEQLNEYLNIKNFKPHNAIYDCIFQIMQLRYAFIKTHCTFNKYGLEF